MNKALPPLYLITDGARVGEARMLEAAARAARGGLRMIQAREKGLGDEELARFIDRLRRAVPPEILLLANGRVRLVEELDLAGVHLGGDVEQVAAARRALQPGRLVGYSAHSIGEVQRAADLGADYASFSPVFRPLSKESPLPAAGLDGLRRVCERARIPVYALGGITADRAASARQAGAAGVAVIGAILDAADPEAAARELLRSWQGNAENRSRPMNKGG
ncbi:MAG: thiamine phosphate synthase [Planctomycetes bacterium]|nr:thiamine phosphate synthase [Planctomycetota bacterium]